jgi:hypothetical protein
MSEPTFDDAILDEDISIIDLIDENRNLINIISANVTSYEVINWGQVIDQDGYWRGRPIDSLSNTTNIFYVSKSGSDNNSGKSLYSSVLTIKKGLELANTYTTETGNICAVSVFPGVYEEDGNLIVPKNCGITSVSGQYVTEVHSSANCRAEFRNMFLINSGSYVQGFTFRNMEVDDFDDPNGGFAIAFKPGALILRSPYIRDCSQVSNYNAFEIAAPLDPANGNPLVGKGGGMLLADRAILNPNSIFPYMLAFGATPRSPNGLGYVAKNGAGINGISSISIFQRAAFYALNGGQITLNNSGTQFGDISMRARGTTAVVSPFSVLDTSALIASTAAADIIANVATSQNTTNDMWNDLINYQIQTKFGNTLISIIPEEVTVPLVASVPAAKIVQYSNLIDAMWTDLLNEVNRLGAQTVIPASVSITLTANSAAAEIVRSSSLIDGMWADLITNEPGASYSWTAEEEAFTRRDAQYLIDALADDIEDGTQTNSQAFALEFFNENTDLVFDPGLLPYFFQTFNNIRDNLVSILVGYQAQQEAIAALVESIKSTMQSPVKVAFGTESQEYFTRRDAANLITAISLDVRYGTQNKTQNFALGFYKYNGAYLFPPYMLRLFQHTWDYLQSQLGNLLVDYPTQANMVNSLFEDVLNKTITDPNVIPFGTELQEALTRRDATNLIRAIQLDVRAGTQMVTRAYAQGFFNYDATLVSPRFYLRSFFRAYDFIQGEMIAALAGYPDQINMVKELISVIKRTLKFPTTINFGSLVESLGHQFNNAGAGVNKNALPLNFRRPGTNRPVPFSVAQENGGRVRWSGADEINNQYFAGGTQINGVTGKFEGRPFNISVRQIARRIANSRGFF